MKNIRTDGGRTADGGDCPPDKRGIMACPVDRKSIDFFLSQLGNANRDGRLLKGAQESGLNGATKLVFYVRLDKAGQTKTERGAAWMRETRKLSRVDFFAACKWANNSCSLYARIIKLMKRTGEVVKENGINVWADI